MALTLADYREAVRSYTKDFSDLNRLLKFEEENANNFIDLYINMALGFLNMMPPPCISYDIGSFPMPSLLVHQAVIESLISNNIVQERNNLTYNNGGVVVKISDGDRYLKIIQVLYRTTELEINAFKTWKVNINIQNGWGASGSPYATIFGQLPIKPNSIL